MRGLGAAEPRLCVSCSVAHVDMEVIVLAEDSWGALPTASATKVMRLDGRLTSVLQSDASWTDLFMGFALSSGSSSS